MCLHVRIDKRPQADSLASGIMPFSIVHHVYCTYHVGQRGHGNDLCSQRPHRQHGSFMEWKRFGTKRPPSGLKTGCSGCFQVSAGGSAVDCPVRNLLIMILPPEAVPTRFPSATTCHVRKACPYICEPDMAADTDRDVKRARTRNWPDDCFHSFPCVISVSFYAGAKATQRRHSVQREIDTGPCHFNAVERSVDSRPLGYDTGPWRFVGDKKARS
jgi:hypothetical protein